MSTNKYSWNETLKFSWGHIIAFVALIFISYVTYMGDFYSNGGDFSVAAIRVFIIDIALLTTFIGSQILKYSYQSLFSPPDTAYSADGSITVNIV